MINPGQILQNRYQMIELIGDYGFGQTWEVDDRGTRKIMKILKVPKVIDSEEMEQAISLFEQEAKVLNQLDAPGLPVVAADGYFIWSEETEEPLHCLVMEKIKGVNLSDWLKQNHHHQPIEEERAIAWLTQLVTIIGKLHQHHCIHRDIKPTNIMLRTPVQENQQHTIAQENSTEVGAIAENPQPLTAPNKISSSNGKLAKSKNTSDIPSGDREKLEETETHKRKEKPDKNHATNMPHMQQQDWGKLALIDFGATREVTETYLRQVEGKNVSDVISQGYTAPEHDEGKITRQSDVYAIGRTLVYLLTAEEPINLAIDPSTNKLIWRNYATHISKKLADLIDDLMAVLPQCRPQTTEDILERLALLQQEVSEENTPTGEQQKPSIPSSPEQKPSSTIPFTNFPDLKPKAKKTKPEKNKWLSKTSLFILGTIAVLIATLPEGPTTCNIKLNDDLSCGEEILIPASSPRAKEEGVKAFAAGNYLQAVEYFEEARRKQINDPETLIYLNNARLAANNIDVYTIAVVAPITGNSQALNYGLEILRGVAQAQDAINKSNNLLRGKGLIVIIADDANLEEQGIRIANDLALTGQVLAVIGHFSSNITLKAAPIYEQNKLVLISPSATSTELSNRNDYFFRVIPSDANMAQAMASYLINLSGDQQQKVALFYNANDFYSASLKNQFLISLTAGGGKIIKDLDDSFDLSRTSFNPSAAISRVNEQKATAIALLPDISTLTKGIEVIKANWQLNLPIVGGDSLYSTYTLTFGDREAERNLVVGTAWQSLNSPEPTFSSNANSLWGGNVSWRTAFAFDATRSLITALESLPERKELNRIAVQKILSSDNFSSSGATGEISFLANGDRQESKIGFAKVVQSSCSP
ncbi:MAG: ABC transporter substrate-binding protein, partial [Microcoleaceae cyanobacterium MO_207.B10]|nr:ABC transporter substrate-binding protein [Microcoleaceae cyanobacterium MO_207.B10]